MKKKKKKRKESTEIKMEKIDKGDLRYIMQQNF